MKLYSFTCILKNKKTFSDKDADRIFERCNDASLSSSQGVCYVDFDREAESYDKAVKSAKNDLKVLGFTVKEIERD